MRNIYFAYRYAASELTSERNAKPYARGNAVL
jgi:hypothetical protein